MHSLEWSVREHDLCRGSARRRRLGTTAFPIALALVLAIVFTSRSATPAEPPVIGVLWFDTPVTTRPFYEAFLRGLHSHGYEPGRNINVEQRWAHGQPRMLGEGTRELVRLRVSVIVTGSLLGVQAAQQSTHVIPIVFATVSDPLGAGLVRSIGYHASNATELTVATEKSSARRLEIVKEALPGVHRAAVLWNSSNRGLEQILRETVTAARAVGIKPHVHDIRRPSDLDHTFQLMQTKRPDVVVVLPDPLFFTLQAHMVELITKAGLPTMFSRREFVDAGGLMSYGPSYEELFERSAGFVDRILKGVKPADMPVEHPSKFELVVNLKTATMLEVTLSKAVLLGADHVIH